jgi:hypothetical protein
MSILISYFRIPVLLASTVFLAQSSFAQENLSAKGKAVYDQVKLFSLSGGFFRSAILGYKGCQNAAFECADIVWRKERRTSQPITYAGPAECFVF